MTDPARLEKLRETVAQLENDLGSLEEVDEQTRALLEQAAADILTTLHKGHESDTETQSLAERLKDSVREFEADHPTFAGVLERLIISLGQMGI